jgi:type I restriction enzyme S subunit
MRKYDSYKDSGIEWIGQVPKHWNLSKVKFLFDTQKGKTPKKLIEKFEEDTLVYLAMDYLRGEPKQIFYVSSEENVVLTDEGETLLLWDGSNAGEFLKSKKGVLSSTMAIIKSQIVNNQFQWYSFKSFESILKDSCNGMGIPHVDGKFLRGSIFLLPSFEEQTAIANFLDQKTSQIDDLIAKKERLIQLLQEERTSIINHAVTKGLDPSVPMKDSGIEWLGEIPAHWEYHRIDWITNIIRGNTGFKKDELLDNGEYVALQYGKTYKVDIVDNSFNFFVNSEFYKESQIVSKGDTILISTSETIEDLGHVCYYDNDNIGLLGGEQILLQPNRDVLYEKYLFQYARQFSLELKKYAKGLKVFRFNTSDLKQLFIAIPSIEEQVKIADFIEGEIIKIDALNHRMSKEIELLKEYKTALVSEVVTGKVDVRNS